MKMRVSSSRVFVCVSVFTGMLLAAFLLLHSRTTTFARNSSGINGSVAGETTKKAPDVERKASILAAYGKLPLAFERNKGQADPQVQYLTRGSEYELFLTSKEAVLALWQPRKAEGRAGSAISPSEARETRKASVLRLQLANANSAPAIAGIDQLERKANYFTGNDRANWVTDVPSYGRVEYIGVYPGINLDFYGNQRQLEYDFAVAPGADPKAIAFRLQGTKSAHIDSRGDLVVNVSSGSVSFRKPLIYQTEGGQRREIAGSYVLAKNDEVGFAVSNYDRARPLIIDPVLDYSTYLGGSANGDLALGVAVDGSGNAFVTGLTFNASLSSSATAVGLGTPDAGITSNGGAFVSEINPAGTQELYFSYISGDGGEIGYGVAVDPVANATCKNGLVNSFCVYVTGQTFSDTFPVSTTVTPYNAGPSPVPATPNSGDAFITKLNPYATGTASLLYSSYLASSGMGDKGQGIAVDSNQNAYITGITVTGAGAPPSFPILNGAQTTLPNANGNAFLTVLNTTASTNALLYSTYLGGNDANFATGELGLGDIGLSLAVDSSKIAYIAGTTVSTNFPNLNSTGTFPNIKGWLGPNGSNSVNEGFLAAINTTLTGVNSLVYSTYVGGSTADRANGVALAGSGVVYITGVTKSSDFTVTQTGTAGQFPSPSDVTGVVFVTKLNTTATGAPTYSVLLGGTSGDVGNGIQLDTLGNVILTGTTQSPDFPVTPGAFMPTRRSTSVGEAFISKINPAATGTAGLLYSTYFGGSGNPPSSIDQGNGVALDTSSNAIIAGQTFSGSDFPISAGAFQTSFSGTSAGFVSKLTLVPVLAFSAPCTFNLAVTPATSCALAFGNQTFHTPSTATTFVLTNNLGTGSNITLTIPPTTSGTNAADFVAAATIVGSTPACTTTLAAGASCGIGVTFTPSAAGAESASLSVAYTYNNGVSTSATQTVALTGTGTSPTVVLNPATTLNFATPQPVGTTSTAQAVTVTNTGLGNLIFSSAPSTGSTEFTISSTTCSTSTPLAQNASCAINITFKPSATGARSATLTIADNATGSPQTLSLTGTGVVSAPIATISPSPVAFGGQLVTTTSTAQTVTVKNTGNANLSITATPSISGTNASDFAIGTNTCTNGASVAANATCTINVTFTPPSGASGSRTATLNITDNASGSPQAVSLAGTAQDFSLSAQPITVAPGSSGTIPVTVTGLGGFTGQVTISCSGTIPQGSCVGPASAVTASGTGNVTVTTHSFVAPPSTMKLPPISRQQLSLGILALMLFFTLPLVSRARTRLGLAGVAALLIFAAGCSNTPPTPANTYTVTITGTSGSVSHSITVNVTVS